jgi:peroxiredoxin
MLAWNGYARWLEGIGDLEGARGAWRGLKAATSSTQNASAVGYTVDEQLKALDQIGRTPIAFPADAKDLEQRAVSLDQFRGSVVLVDFWATWCSPCRAEMPEIVSAYERFHDQGFEVVGVSIDAMSDAAKVRQFASQNGIPWRTVHFASGRNTIAETWGVKGVPHTVLIGRDGRIFRVGLRGRELVRQIGKLVTGK